MSIDKIALDKYIEREPDYDFENWCEQVTDKISPPIYIQYGDLIVLDNGLVNKWMNKLYDKYRYYDTEKEITSVALCAEIIERALTRFIKP